MACPAPDVPDPFPVEVWLRIRVLPGDPPGAIRMRHVLKSLLRSHGLKCERLLPAGESKDPPGDDGKG